HIRRNDQLQLPIHSEERMTTVSLVKKRSRTTPSVETLEQSHRFSVEKYHRMIEAGVLGPDQKVELLDGLVVEKTGQNPPHSSTLRKLLRLFDSSLPDEFVTRPQLPITLATSEPEP